MGGRLSKRNRHNRVYGITRVDNPVYLTPFELQNSGRYRFGGVTDHRQLDPNEFSGSPVTVNPVFINDEPVNDVATPSNIWETTLNDTIAYMVDAFRDVLEGSVKVMDIIPRLPFIGDADTFRSKDRDSPSNAMSFLLDKLKASDQPGKWQSFIEALAAAEYPYIVHLLKGKTDVDHTITKQILSIFTPQLVDRIDPKRFIDHLYEREVISKKDVEEIQCELTNRGAMAASFLILDRIPRRKENWYNEFVDVLQKCEMDELVGEFQTPPPSVCGRGYMHGSGNGQFMTVPEYDSGSETAVKRRFHYDHYQSAPPAYDTDNSLSQRPRSRSIGGSQKTRLPRIPSALASKLDALFEQKNKLETELKEKKQFQELKNDIAALKTQLKHIEQDHEAAVNELFEDENIPDAPSDTRPNVIFGLDICNNRPVDETIDSNKDETRVQANHSSTELKNMSSRLDRIMTVVCELRKDMDTFGDILREAKSLKLSIHAKLTNIDKHVTEEVNMRLRQPPHPHEAFEEPIYISADSAMWIDDQSYDTKL